jgi:hypothetical protein
MLTEPIVVTVDAESRSYSRISTGPGKSSSYRAKNPAGVDDAHLNIKHQDASGRAKALFKGVVAKLEADTDAILDSVLWGES